MRTRFTDHEEIKLLGLRAKLFLASEAFFGNPGSFDVAMTALCAMRNINIELDTLLLPYRQRRNPKTLNNVSKKMLDFVLDEQTRKAISRMALHSPVLEISAPVTYQASLQSGADGQLFRGQVVYSFITTFNIQFRDNSKLSWVPSNDMTKLAGIRKQFEDKIKALSPEVTHSLSRST